MSQKTIEIEHLSKTYGSIVAIENIHLNVEAGEIIGFLGPNGAGKTTTMRILTGYLPATTGTVRIAGYDVHQHSMQVRRAIGYLPETPPLYTHMTVKGFLHFVAKIKGVRAKERSRQVNKAIMRCQLIDRKNTIISKLSKSYRQRVGIAQAIVHEPPVIILDEPTVGLDPRQIIEVQNLIKSLAGEHTIILSTHMLPEANTICDRIAIINRGKIITIDTPQNLQAQLKSNSYEIEVAGEIDCILPLLSEVEGVIEASLDHNFLHSGDRHLLKIVCKPDTEPGANLSAIIIEQGLKLYEMRRTRHNLEDVFLQLTTKESVNLTLDRLV